MKINGFRYHYVDEGDGAPVVMLHGNPTWSFYFRNLISSLKSSFRTIAPDHIGCGLSEKPGPKDYNYTLDRRVADLELFLEHLGITENINLILHDWGGMIGLAYFVRHPEQVNRVVLMNTSGFKLPEDAQLPLSLRLARSPLTGPFLVQGLNLFCRGAQWFCSTKGLPRSVRRGYLKPYNSWKNRIAVLKFVQDIPVQPGDTAYETVETVENNLHLLKEKKVCIIWGEQDFVFGPEFLKEWTRRLPNAEIHTFPDAGHFILEDAAEPVVEIIRKFLRSLP